MLQTYYAHDVSTCSPFVNKFMSKTAAGSLSATENVATAFFFFAENQDIGWFPQINVQYNYSSVPASQN